MSEQRSQADHYRAYGPSTRAIHAGFRPDPQTGAVNTPIYASSTFAQDGVGGLRGVVLPIRPSNIGGFGDWYARFDAAAMLKELEDSAVTTFCAPPTVWRMMIQAHLGDKPSSLREAPSRPPTVWAWAVYRTLSSGVVMGLSFRRVGETGGPVSLPAAGAGPAARP